MIVGPPAAPRAITGRPSRRTIVGEIELRGRLPGPGRFGSRAAPWVGAKLKSVSSLLSRKPRPGTTIALPPVSSRVNVYSTMLPQRSATVRLVVLRPPGDGTSPGAATAQPPDPSPGEPGGTGLGSAMSREIRQARSLA